MNHAIAEMVVSELEFESREEAELFIEFAFENRMLSRFECDALHVELDRRFPRTEAA